MYLLHCAAQEEFFLMFSFRFQSYIYNAAGTYIGMTEAHAHHTTALRCEDDTTIFFFKSSLDCWLEALSVTAFRHCEWFSVLHENEDGSS